MRPIVRLGLLSISVVLLVAGLVPIAPVRAGQQSTVFYAGTQTVPLFTTVVGPDGRLVTDLTKDDFEVYDDGVPQPITVFGNAIQPINIVVLLDASDSMVGTLETLKDASVELFAHLLPDDKARVGSFGNQISVSPRLTNDRNELVRWVWTEVASGGPTPLWGAVNVGMTALQQIDGRRVVLVFTDGYNSSGRDAVTLRDITSRAQSEQFMIYSVGLWSRTTGQWHTRNKDGLVLRGLPPDPGLKALSEETGGGYFELLDSNNLGLTFTRVADELHHQYLLGFDAARLDGRLHKLDVRVRRPAMSARARKSYVAKGTAP